jgi:hypothetical protein
MAISESDSIRQLRHDTLSTTFWYHHAWRSCPGPQPDTIELAYCWVLQRSTDAEVFATLHPHLLVDTLLEYVHEASNPETWSHQLPRRSQEITNFCAFHKHHFIMAQLVDRG